MRSLAGADNGRKKLDPRHRDRTAACAIICCRQGRLSRGAQPSSQLSPADDRFSTSSRMLQSQATPQSQAPVSKILYLSQLLISSAGRDIASASPSRATINSAAKKTNSQLQVAAAGARARWIFGRCRIPAMLGAGKPITKLCRANWMGVDSAIYRVRVAGNLGPRRAERMRGCHRQRQFPYARILGPLPANIPRDQLSVCRPASLGTSDRLQRHLPRHDPRAGGESRLFGADIYRYIGAADFCHCPGSRLL